MVIIEKQDGLQHGNNKKLFNIGYLIKYKK